MCYLSQSEERLKKDFMKLRARLSSKIENLAMINKDYLEIERDVEALYDEMAVEKEAVGSRLKLQGSTN